MYVCVCLSLFIFSCEKEAIDEDSSIESVELPDDESSQALVYDPETGLTATFEKAAIPQGCCRCELQVTANAISTTGGPPFINPNAWSIRLDNLSTGNCPNLDNSGSVLQVGQNTINTYDVPGTMQSYEFYVKGGQPSSANLSAFIVNPDDYSGVLPLNVYGQVVCQIPVSSPYEVFNLTMNCPDTGSGLSSDGCNGTYLTQHGNFTDSCSAHNRLTPRD